MDNNKFRHDSAKLMNHFQAEIRQLTARRKALVARVDAQVNALAAKEQRVEIKDENNEKEYPSKGETRMCKAYLVADKLGRILIGEGETEEDAMQNAEQKLQEAYLDVRRGTIEVEENDNVVLRFSVRQIFSFDLLD